MTVQPQVAAPYGDFIDALRHAGAVSPPSAVPLGDLPTIPAEHLRTFLQSGMVRQAAPGTYYVPMAEQHLSALEPRSQPFTPIRVTLMMVVWLIAILVPIVGWLIAR